MTLSPAGLGIPDVGDGGPLASAPLSLVMNALNTTSPFQSISGTFGIARRSFTVAEWATCNTAPIAIVPDSVAGAGVLVPLWGICESNVPTNGSIGGVAYQIWPGLAGVVTTAGGSGLTTSFNGYTGVTVPPKKLIEQFVQQGTVTFTDLTRTGKGLYVRSASNPAQQANSTVVLTLIYLAMTPVPAL